MIPRLPIPVLASAMMAALALAATCQEKEKPQPANADAAGAREGARIRTVAIPDAVSVKDDQEKIAKWLSAKIGIPVEYTHVPDYGAAVVALATGKADLGWLGGATTVEVMDKSKGKVAPFVSPDNNLHFKSYLIAGKKLGAKKLEDLKGKTFNFGNKTSTSGHIMARYCLEQAGVDPEKFFSKVAYSGNHTATIMNVASGAVDCGILNYTTLDRLLVNTDPKDADKVAAAKSVDIVWTTPEYVDYAWNVRSDLDERCGKGTIEKIKAAFLALDAKKAEDAAVLKVHGGSKYVAVQGSQWKEVKSVLDRIDIYK